MLALALAPVLFGLPSFCGIVDTQFAHLIVPLNKAIPDTAINTQKSFDIERDIYTEFLFDVPNSDAIWCNLHLTINTDATRGAPWHVWGLEEPFVFNVSTLSRPINKDADTWNNHPTPKDSVAQFKVYNNGVVEQHGGQWLTCPKGNTAEFIAHPADVKKEGGFTIYELDEPLHGLTYEAWVYDNPVVGSE
ncbi:hypothetical protein P280DRAFT_442211 [Massarina eburnea CBS 473.64]|uniref:Ubiquitin 3 binding protein But2 C-terminal domain-containing protein n=1 Tax=Massarina eburnea CBS 473.64 TaxID=1395130 RepID=A0A6A6SCK6_9PLEO|nr:hypothetical protein P280DRAFT_442211 [Massarina eburnea CBS 473.64]